MAEKLGIDIEFRGTTVKLDDSLNYISKNIKNLKKDIKALDKDFKLELNADTLRKNIETVTYALAESEKAAELFNKEIESINVDGYTYLNEEGKEVIVTAEEARVKMTQFTASLDAQNAVTKELKKKYDDLSKTLKNLDTLKSIENLKALRDEMRKAGDTLTGFANAFRGLSTLSLAGLGGAFTAAKDFETAFVGVMKTVDETTTTTYDDIEKSIRKMATTLPTSAKEIAGVMEIAGQLGVKADDLEKFSKTMIDLSNATNILGSEGATQVAQFYNVMKGDLQTVDRFGAALTHLGNNAATTEAEILRMATNLAGVGANLRITEQDILGLATGLASVGISAEKGGSAVSNILLKISREVETNGDQLEAWAGVAGMTAKQFQDAWSENSVSAFFKVLEGLGTLEDENTSLIEVLDDVEVKNIRQIDTLSRLANSYQNLDRYLEMSNDAWNENSALTNEANRRYGTVESQIQVLKNTVTEMALQLGKSLLPVLKDVINFVKPLVKTFGDWVGANSALVSSMLIFTPVFTKLTAGFGSFLSSSATLVTSMIKLKEATVGMSGAAGALGKAIGFAGTAGLVASIVAASTAAAYLGYKMFEVQTQVYQTKKAFEETKTALENQTSAFNTAYENAGQLYQQTNQDLQLVLQGNKEYIDDIQMISEKLQNQNLTRQERALLEQQLQEKIGLVNGALGQEAILFDSETGKVSIFGQAINELKSAYEQLMLQMQIQSWLQSHEDAYNQAMQTEQAWNTSAVALWNEQNAKMQQYHGVELPKTQEEMQGLIDKYGSYSKVVTDAEKYLGQYNTKLGELNTLTEQEINFLATYNDALNGNITNIDQLNNSTSQEIDLETQAKDALELTKLALEKKVEGLNENQKAAKEYYEQQIKDIDEELKKREEADEAAQKSSDALREKLIANFEESVNSASLATQSIKTDFDGIEAYTFSAKHINIYYHEIGRPSDMGNYSANGGGSSSGRRGSGGFGEVKLTTNIHINNNGTPINEQEVNRWVNVITDKLDVALGGKM